jgi:hypothetical protein
LTVSYWDDLVDRGNLGKGLRSLQWHDFSAYDVMKLSLGKVQGALCTISKICFELASNAINLCLRRSRRAIF